MNRAFRDLFTARVAGAAAAAQALGSVEHDGLKGALREVLVRDLLRPLLPPSIGVGHGVVITAYDEQSSEQDVILFDRNSMPCLVVDAETGVFPIEAVLFAIEVKSVLTSTELQKTHQKARRMEKLTHIPGGKPPEHVIPCLFAFQSDLQHKDEIERYTPFASDGPEPAIRGICVLGRGLWFWNKGGWHHEEASANYREIACLLDQITFALQRLTESRARPKAQQYVE